MIDPTFSSPQEIWLGAKDNHHEWLDSSIPATKALERLEWTPRRERLERGGKAPVVGSCQANEPWPKQSKTDAFDMSDLYSASRPIESTIDFPLISWISDYDQDKGSFARLASKHSVSCSDALVAPLHSTLATSWSTSSLLGKRRRSRASNKFSCQQQQRLVRSIAWDADLSSLLTIAPPQSIQDTTNIAPIRSINDAKDERTSTSVEFNFSSWINHAAHTTPDGRNRHLARVKECLRIIHDADRDGSSPFSKKSP